MPREVGKDQLGTSNIDRVVIPAPQTGKVSVVYLYLIQGKSYQKAIVHWFTDEEGNKRRVICPSAKDCPICKAIADGSVEFKDLQTNNTFFFNVVQGELMKNYKKKDGTILPLAVIFADSKAKLLEKGWSIANGIQTVILDEEDIFDVTKNYIKIIRTGKGRFDTEYSVKKGQAPIIWKYDRKIVTDINNLDELVKPTPIETINSYIGIGGGSIEEELEKEGDEFNKEGEEVAESVEKPKGKRGRPVGSTAKPKPSAAVEEEFELPEESETKPTAKDRTSAAGKEEEFEFPEEGGKTEEDVKPTVKNGKSTKTKDEFEFEE